MKVLIGSIFASHDQSQKDWLDLQLKFIKATTKSFEHVAVVWGEPDNLASEFGQQNLVGFYGNTKVIKPDTVPENILEYHLFGLQALKQYFEDHENEADYFLFLDCDAFPIKKNWLPELLL